VRDSAYFEPLSIKIRPWLCSVRWFDKKMLQESFISSVCPESPRQRIFTKFRANVSLVNIINHDKFCDKLFKDFDFAGVKISGFCVRK